MTISVDHDAVTYQLKKLINASGDTEETLGKLPEAPDAGIASAQIGLIASAAAEGAWRTADILHLVAAVATEALKDLHETEQDILASVKALEREVNG